MGMGLWEGARVERSGVGVHHTAQNQSPLYRAGTGHRISPLPMGAQQASSRSHEAGHPLPLTPPAAPSRCSEGKGINNNDNNRMAGRLAESWLYICMLSICGSCKEDTNELIKKIEIDPQA